MPKLVLIQVEDWVALYADGRLVDQNHSLSPRTYLEAAGVEHEVNYHDGDATDQYFRDGDAAPVYLAELPGYEEAGE